MKLLIIGHARHGKDVFADYLCKELGLKKLSSSWVALDKFIYKALSPIMGYQSKGECYKDRVNHRALWYELIKAYNHHDKARLTTEVYKVSDMYVGLRDDQEFSATVEKFNPIIIGVFDPRKPLESEKSFKVGDFKLDHLVINNGSLEDLENKAKELALTLRKEEEC